MMKHLSLILGTVLILIVVPLAIPGGYLLFDYLYSTGLRINANYTGGRVLGEITDPEGDVLLQIPDSFHYKSISNSLDSTCFSVRLVRFPFPSGQGIENHLNLVAEFNGKFSDPLDLHNGFGCNVIHFYIDSPYVKSLKTNSEKAAAITFSSGSWDYQVIVDGFHDKARIYNNTGNLIRESTVYVREEKVPAPGLEKEKWQVKKTSVIATIPLSFSGDVLKGEWHYYALTGIADITSLSFLFAPDKTANVYDAINYKKSSDAEGILTPLVIKDGKMQ
ncbi:MAG: hypothetical protein JXB88_10885 [Spirochaetales bacterium]|nr:hypothetical protein [Spirochaetales bacterium]